MHGPWCMRRATDRQGSSKSIRSSRSADRGGGAPGGGQPDSPKLDRHPSLRFSVKRQLTTTSGGSRKEIADAADPYSILTSLQREAAHGCASVKSNPAVDLSSARDILATAGLSPRGSRDDLTKALIGSTGSCSRPSDSDDPMFIVQLVAYLLTLRPSPRGGDRGVGGLDPMKICRMGQSMF